MTLEPGAESSTAQSSDSSDVSLESIEEAVSGNPSSLFRVMQAKLDSPATPSVRINEYQERTIDEMTSLEPHFYEHEKVTGLPFTASYLRLEKVYKNLEMQEQVSVKRIDSYIGDQLEAEHLKPTAQSAMAIVQKLESELGLSIDHDPYFRIEKMASYIAALQDHQEKESLRFHLTGQRSRDTSGRFL